MNRAAGTIPQIRTYEEAKELVVQIGLLPLTPLIPGYPGLSSVTPEGSWHSGTEFDPWDWRARFAMDGAAAYGKFLKQKAVLVAPALFPAFRSLLSDGRLPRERYKDGLAAKESAVLYEAIESEQGIDARSLRSAAGLKAKEMKKAFDQGLTDLMACGDIVISGVAYQINANGDKSGWSASTYETSEYWLNKFGLPEERIEREEAVDTLIAALSPYIPDEGFRWLRKQLRV